MADRANFWAIAYDDIARAEQVWRDAIILAAGRATIDLADVAVLQCHRDGSYTLDRQPFPQPDNTFRVSTVRFIATLALGAPFSSAGVDSRLDTAWSNISRNIGIDQKFMDNLKRLIKPGRSALLVVDRAASLQKILQGVAGPGGTMLNAKANLKQVRLLQSLL